jgi:hypothetical protein
MWIDGRTDCHDEANIYLSHVCERAWIYHNSKAAASSLSSDFFTKLPSLRFLPKLQAETPLPTLGGSQLQVNSG